MIQRDLLCCVCMFSFSSLPSVLFFFMILYGWVHPICDINLGAGEEGKGARGVSAVYVLGPALFNAKHNLNHKRGVGSRCTVKW